jgi:hypothetical protein
MVEPMLAPKTVEAMAYSGYNIMMMPPVQEAMIALGIADANGANEWRKWADDVVRFHKDPGTLWGHAWVEVVGRRPRD